MESISTTDDISSFQIHDQIIIPITDGDDVLDEIEQDVEGVHKRCVKKWSEEEVCILIMIECILLYSLKFFFIYIIFDILYI